MSLYLNGNIIKGSLVIDGEAFYKATILEGSASTNKWSEPLVYNSVNVFDYEVLCLNCKVQNTSFTMYYHTEDLPISQTAGQGNNYIVILNYAYLYIDTNGYLYFYVETGKTLELNEVVAYSGKEQEVRELPYVVYSNAINCYQTRTITFTATENGTYQLYVFWTTSSTPSMSDVDVKLNGTTITLTNAITGYGRGYIELNLSVNDVLTISNTFTDSNRGVIVFVTQNASISDYELLGEESNNNQTFPIGHDGYALECYQFSFYSGSAKYNYMIVTDAPYSIATPSGSSSYYYGGTWAIKV